MADPSILKILKQGVNAINEWRVTNCYEFIDLKGVDLQGVDLQGVNFNRAHLEGANLKGANLEGAQLNETFLNGANLEEANLRRNNLSDSILNGANLAKADLRDSYFYRANFENARLYKANFCETSLSYSNFCNTDLSNANLYKSTLHKTHLNNANLQGADLQSADLCEADLSRARLNEANLCGTNLDLLKSDSTFWVGVDLSQTVGLESVNHLGPSYLGVDTLMKSKGQIPEVFLRGCGLSDDFISFIPSHFANSAIDFYSCFISYSHEDKSFARRLHDGLQGKGIRCWLDEKKMLPGDDFGEHIDRGIKVWDKILLCASKHSLTSYWVNKELEHTFAKEEQLFKRETKPVRSLIPLNLDDYLFTTWEHQEKNSICNRLAADFTDWETDNSKFEEQFERVVKALQTNSAGRDPDPPRKL